MPTGKILVSDPTAGILGPWQCGPHIVFPWVFQENANTLSIWRINADGSHIVLLDTATLSSQRFLQADPRISKGVQFTTDGKAVGYPITENGVDNIWIQLIDGASRRRITQFNS